MRFTAVDLFFELKGRIKMRNIFIKKTLVSALAVTALIGVLPIAANAEWKEKDGNKYYFDDEDGTYVTGWMQDKNGNWYYFNNNGVMQKNTTIDGYVLGADGVWNDGKKYTSASTSDAKNTEGIWKLDGGKWYFYDKSGTILRNTTVTTNGKDYKLGADGACDWENNTGSSSYKSEGLWSYNNGKWYYKSKGESSYFKGWLNEGGKWYYLDQNGVMQQNTTIKIDSKDYTFGSNGVCTNK